MVLLSLTEQMILPLGDVLTFDGGENTIAVAILDSDNADKFDIIRGYTDILVVCCLFSPPSLLSPEKENFAPHY
ncbi:hypothetical protein MiAbW_01014 [Microcystis aeruginosa NIES-4325]|uniref:Uncharacterized protein n=1 Tax=Microcystis aeruginosa NIES-4325 TaxID=2569534 RepID=A0A5J4F5V3_MICAE|nr:hypothetical protein MiAbW_01014 [Microcystis aeruginosa NIES-4325]